tara:strand:- start:315 stop:569 length:255 start_codon:yes stop_codon:yes gene_type:complete
MPFFTQEDIETGNWENRTEELMAMVNLYHSKNEELKKENETLEEEISDLMVVEEEWSGINCAHICIKKLQEENEELKKEIESLK